MRRAGALIAVAALAALLSGCHTLSARECQSGDWERIGRDDGAKGTKPDELERHRKACAAHAVKPDEARYRAGYAEGLKQYCTPASGYVAARRGEGHRDVCRASGNEEKFLEAFRHGREVWILHQDLIELRRRAEETRYAAMTDEPSPDQRTSLLFRAEEWQQRAQTKQWDLERLDRRYAKEYGAPELSWTELRSR
jgi:hypothetical protein